MHNHFRVEIMREMVVFQLQQIISQLCEICQLPIEREAIPLPFTAVMSFERLGETAFIRPTRGVADVTDGGFFRRVPA